VNEHLPLDQMRTPSPLRDSDFAAIRARVRSEIQERSRRRRVWLPLLRLATAALIVVGAAMVLRQTEPPAPQAPITVATVPQPPPEPTPQPDPEPEPERRATIAKKRPSHERIARTDGPMTIHIQTADPDVRIIWIVSPNKEES
jgi:hypothetical protein